MEKFEELSYIHNAWEVWNDFLILSACSLSNAVDKGHFKEREERYLHTIRKYASKKEQAVFPELLAIVIMALEDEPDRDFLGKIHTYLGFSDHRKGQFFTPDSVGNVMASMTESDIVWLVREKGYISIGDTCCGAGGNLIAGVNVARKYLERENLNYQNHIMVVAEDIDETVALMCYIQLSLLGVAGYIKIGDCFTDPISNGDSTENYWFTPMFFSTVWTTRRLLKEVSGIFNKANTNAD